MKRYIYIVLILLSLASCVDLVEVPDSNQTTTQFYRNESDAAASVNAIYTGLNASGQTLYNSLFQIGVEMATDDYEAGPRARNAHVRAISALTHDPSNDRMQQLWKQSYDLINRANIAIDRITLINSANITDKVRPRTINEAKFLRALNYFNLVRWFGDVPIILHETTSLAPEALQVKQSPADSVYALIVRDLKDAENLPTPLEYTSSDAGRASSGSAKSLLSKVYLTHKDWNLAAKKSQEVIDSKWYDLFDDFADVFNVATKNGKEHIFSAQFKGNFNFVGNSLASRAAPTEPPGINGDYADALHVAGGLYASYSSTDKRRDITFVSQMVSPTDGKTYKFTPPHLHKYYDQSVVGNQGQSSKNLPIIRYAEVLLIYAEAKSEANNGPTDSAFWAIDKVRTRAGIPKLIDTYPGLTTDQFRDTVFQERRKELVFEYQRWFDIARRGADYYVKTLKAAGKTNAAPRHIYFPIPQREIDLNPNLKQNPVWVNY